MEDYSPWAACAYREFRPYQLTSLWRANRRSRGCTFLVGKHIGVAGFVHTARQFYVARFLLGAAESSFFPAMIVYLTHWFRLQERGRAIACLFAAVPAASLVGSPLAGWLLGVHWRSLAGWRWFFLLKGIPAIVLGIITVFYLTDWPAQARWLPDRERN
jgi:ACS family tartrate transporter-like MFS transporter